MLKKIILPTMLVILAYGFWISPNFKEIAAGVAIFLFGMFSLEEGFRAFTGGTLEKVLRKSTNKMWKSLSFGFTAATIMQSSSLVSVITISFLSAGLIGLVQGMGIIFGANVGTTTGAWLIAGFGLKVKISAYAMPMLVFGVVLVFQKSKSLKGFGYILAGLGFLFLGIHHMKEGFETFQTQINLTDYAMEGFAGLLVFTLIGILATIIMQSSHATLVLVITALSVQQLTYDNALALVIGANVGTTITAILGSLTSNTDGKRLALSDVLFKVSAGIVFILMINQITWLVDVISDIIGLAPTDYTLKLAVFHTIFNVAGVIIMIPLVNPLVRLVTRLMPDKTIAEAEPMYLNESAFELPDTALESVRKETVHLYENAFAIIAHGLSLHRHDILSEDSLEDIADKPGKPMSIDMDDEYDNKIKDLYSEIVSFISKSSLNMSEQQADELFMLRAAGRDIVEAIKDTKHMHGNLVQYIASDNQYIREEYNKIRAGLGSVMRRLENIRKDEDDMGEMLLMDVIKLEMEEHDRMVNDTIERLIREGRITARMATSLMNDSAYAYDVARNLVQMGEVLFTKGDSDFKAALRSVQLDEDDADEIVNLQH